MSDKQSRPRPNVLWVQLPEWLKKELELRAEEGRRSLSKQTILVLEKGLKALDAEDAEM